MARRTLSLHAEGAVHTVEAWFDYGECYMPSDPTTTGAFGFSTWAGDRRSSSSPAAPRARKPLKLDAVPGVLLSETIRSLEVALAEAGAKKDEGNEDEEGEGGGGDEGDDDA
jgi:hypothetical protein